MMFTNYEHEKKERKIAFFHRRTVWKRYTKTCTTQLRTIRTCVEIKMLNCQRHLSRIYLKISMKIEGIDFLALVGRVIRQKVEFNVFLFHL